MISRTHHAMPADLAARCADLWATGGYPSRSAALEEAVSQLAREAVSREAANRDRPGAANVVPNDEGGRLFVR